MAPYSKTGGLADVVGALPEALDALGHDVTVVTPKYRTVKASASSRASRRVWVGQAAHDVSVDIVELSDRRRVAFLDYPPFFDRDGIYGAAGVDFEDNADRFALLALTALDVAATDDRIPRPEVVHAHDWQAGLVPLSLWREPRRWPAIAHTGLVLTIHNLAYQGLFPRDVVPRLGLPWDVFTMERGEFWGQFSFLKSGIAVADYVTTVSPAYARETLTSRFGAGLEGVLRARGDRYLGILNGIDTSVWDPANDPFLPASFDASDVSGKLACKRAVFQRFGLSQGDDALSRPVIGLVSRLVEQKGLDLVDAASDALLEMDAAWVFLGSGEARFEQFLQGLGRRHPSRVGVYIGFDEGLAHLVEAGSDMFLMPSKFEPCGLNQMYSLRYGTVPIVHAVGGLDDTIQGYSSRARGANGFKMQEPTPDELTRVVRQAVRLFHDRPTWARLMQNGMTADHSWRQSAKEYVKVYRRARLDAAHRGNLRAPGA